MNSWHLLVSVLLAGASLAAASPAAADQYLRGVLDGEQKQWQVLESQGQSTAYFSDSGGYLDITLQGHEDARFSTKGAVSISMLAMDGRLPDEAEVIFFPEATLLPNYNSDGQDGELELTRFERNGDRLRISGRYRGTLGYVESARQRGEATRHMEVDIEFDLVLPQD
jgi:hypothetical protein